MDSQQFKDRTKAIALEVIQLSSRLPRTETIAILRKQMIRAGTSIGANYRSACRSRSDAEMVAKLGIVLEETDETLYWLELITVVSPHEGIEPISNELNQIAAMTVASINTIKARMKPN